MPGLNAVTFSGKGLAGFGREAVGPFVQHRHRRLVQAGHLLISQALAELERRQPGAMEDLIGIGIADAAQQSRIGESALEGPVLPAKRFGELAGRRGEDVHASRIEGGESLAPLDKVERRPPFLAGFGEQQRASGELEGCEHVPRPRPPGPPAQPRPASSAGARRS